MVVALPIADMGEARLVLTEALIRATLRREKAAIKQQKTEEKRRRRESAAVDNTRLSSVLCHPI